MKLDPAKARLISGFVDSYLKLNASEMQQFEREIEYISIEEKEFVMPLTISWKEEGRVEEAKSLILRQGKKRFGIPNETTVNALEAIDSIEQLELMAERLLEVESWHELLSD